MTSPAIIPITYDAVDLSDWTTGIYAEIVSGIAESPVVRGEDTTIPAAAGSLEGNRINDYLPIELRVVVRAAEAPAGTQRASYYANLRTVRALFASNRPRADLVATLPTTVPTILTISANPLNIIGAELFPGEYAELSISLRGNGDWTVT